MTNLIIYSITNAVTGKKYIGQTRQGLRQRAAEHRCRFNLGERDHKLYQSMRKHGFDSFKFEAIERCGSAAALDERERFWIAHFNSFNRGYNMTCGGDSVSDETREKLRAINKGRKILWYDKILETRKKNRRLGLEAGQKKGAESTSAKRYRVKTPLGDVIEVRGLHRFCTENGLSSTCLRHTLTGYRGIRAHKGYSLLERFND